MSDSLANGKIVTFYSYKGGTGRSMALANVAWILASRGQRVLIVDWDLEAPGLHRYFHPFLLDKELTSTRGLIDLVWDFANEAMTPVQPEKREKGWHEEHANILRYATAVRWRFKNERGRIDLVPAGKQGASYASRVNSFNWPNFYERFGGGVFLETVKQKMRAHYDYILIDSRTGVSDTSGICTVQIPDHLVVFCTANTQSIDGTAAVAESVRQQWAQEADKHDKGVVKRKKCIFPVMTRVELGELDKLQAARNYVRARFNRVVDHIPASSRADYWAKTETLYVPWYAYEEVLATFKDEPDEKNSLLASAEWLTAFLTDELVSKLDPPDEEDRKTVLQQFSRGITAKATSEQAAYDVFVSYSHQDREWVSVNLLPNLRSAGLKTFVDVENVSFGDRWDDTLSQALQKSRQAVVVMSRAWTQSDWAQHELHTALNAAAQKKIRVVPILMERCEIPVALRGIAYADMTDPSKRGETIQRLLRSLGGQIEGEAAVKSQAGAQREFVTDISRIIKYAPAEFIGREDELKMLNDAWARVHVAPSATSPVPAAVRPHILTFVGLGGEGKTSLVAKWAAELASQDWPGCDAAFAWSFYSQGTREQLTVSSDRFLEEALTFFGDDADKAFANSPAGAFEKGQRLARLVGQRRSLLILDGIEPLQYASTAPTPGELKDQGLSALLKGLAATSHGLCVLTTRYSLPDLKAFWQSTATEIQLLRLSRDAGVHLLKALGVRGSERRTYTLLGSSEPVNELEKLVEDVKGHALTLTLLGGFLKRAFHGDIRQRDRVKFEKADEKMDGGHAFRTMAAYEQWLLRDGGDEGRREVAVLRLMGLFDRPADAGCLAALRREPIPGLTEPLAGLADDDWEFCLSGLEAARMLIVNRDAVGELVSLDAHPHLREYFARQLRTQQPDVWRAAHQRLYEHLCATTAEKHQPTLEDLQPLYQAVAHGCQAGLQQEVYAKVFVARIRRGNDDYSVKKLGVPGSDLGAISCFFDPPWSRLSPLLPMHTQAALLGQSAFYLRALGRLTESLEPMRASLKMSIQQQNIREASIRASNLSELELTLGEVAGAVGEAEQAVTYADRSGDAGMRMLLRTTLADALRQAGRRAEAESLFRQAEQMQQEMQPDFPLLYSLAGFEYCDLLLAAPERAAWQLTLHGAARMPFQHGDDKAASNELESGSGINSALQSCHAVSQRAQKMFEWRSPSDPLLDIALDHLTLGRLALYEAILGVEASVPASRLVGGLGPLKLETARRELDAAVSGLRRAGRSDVIPQGLLARAWLRSLTGACTGPESAQADLDEAWEIAERGPMKLFLCDIHAHRARLFFREKDYPWNKNPDGSHRGPKDDLAAAEKLINKCGYHRRDEELADAKRAILGT